MTALTRRAASWVADTSENFGVPGDPDAAGRVVAVAADIAALSLAPGLLKASGLPPGLSIAYGWNPLAIKECAANGRPVAIAVLLLAVAIRALQGNSKSNAGVAYGASLTTSLWTAACLPAMVRPLAAYLVLSLGIGGAGWAYWILSGAGSIPWEAMPSFGGSLFPVTSSLARLFLTREVIYPLGLGMLSWLAFAVYRGLRRSTKPARIPQEVLLSVGSLLLVSPLVLPWFFVPIAYFAAFSPNRGWLVFTLTAPLGYLAMGRPSFWIGFAQYFPAYFTLIFLWLGRTRRKSFD